MCWRPKNSRTHSGHPSHGRIQGAVGFNRKEVMKIVKHFWRAWGHLATSWLLLSMVALASPNPGKSRVGSHARGFALLTDTNRDGAVDRSDQRLAASLRGRFDWQRGGAFVMANVDDDDQDGRIDALDDVINGTKDLEDLASIIIEHRQRFGVPVFGSDSLPVSLQLAAVKAQEPQTLAPINFFGCDDTVCTKAENPIDLEVHPGQQHIVRAESREFASGDWNGVVQLELRMANASNDTKVLAKTELRVAPWLALPDTAQARRVFVASGVYPNTTFLQQLQETAARQSVEVTQRNTSRWQEMWVQDTFEMGVAALPGRSPMHVVLNGVRGAGIDGFGPSLLAPDVGLIQVAEPRQLGGGDAWADWMGNLSVTPPTRKHPQGRLYYGVNEDTGVGLHPKVVSFLAAQELQEPFALDTSFLEIKHVDEMISFVPGPANEVFALVASPGAAADLLPQRPWSEHDAKAQAVMDKNVATMQQAVGLDATQIINLPIRFTPEGAALWSNPVNSLVLNGLQKKGTLVIGNTDMPKVVVQEMLTLLATTELELVFVDDSPYQKNSGNVHCATNSLRMPPAGFFSYEP